MFRVLKTRRSGTYAIQVHWLLIYGSLSRFCRVIYTDISSIEVFNRPDTPCQSAHFALEFINERSHFLVLVSADVPNASCWMWPSKTDFLHLWSVRPNLRGYDALSVAQEPSFTLYDAPYAPIKSLMLPRCSQDTVLGPVATAVFPKGMDMGSPFLGVYR